MSFRESLDLKLQEFKYQFYEVAINLVINVKGR